MTEWRVGMEAVFIGWPKGFKWRSGDPVLRENAIYVIESIALAPKGSQCVAINGHVVTMPQDFVYLGILGKLSISLAFRPVQKRATDISVFHELRRGIERVVKEKA